MATYDVDKLRQFKSKLNINVIAGIYYWSDYFVIATFVQDVFVEFFSFLRSQSEMKQYDNTENNATDLHISIYHIHHTHATNSNRWCFFGW